MQATSMAPSSDLPVALTTHPQAEASSIAASTAPPSIDYFEPADIQETIEEATAEMPDNAAWDAGFPAEPPLINRANGWAVIKDFKRELATCFRDAYAALRQGGLVPAIRMLTSHLAQLFVGTSAFFMLNLGRSLQALWRQVHRDPTAG